MRETGRGFIPYFIAGTALHAGWNALYIGFIYSLTGIEGGTDPSAGQAVAVMAIVLLLGSLFIAGFGWFISAARAAGLSAQRELSSAEFDRSHSSYAAVPGNG
jgi:hypothetical protein